MENHNKCGLFFLFRYSNNVCRASMTRAQAYDVRKSRVGYTTYYTSCGWINWSRCTRYRWEYFTLQPMWSTPLTTRHVNGLTCVGVQGTGENNSPYNPCGVHHLLHVMWWINWSRCTRYRWEYFTLQHMLDTPLTTRHVDGLTGVGEQDTGESISLYNPCGVHHLLHVMWMD